MAKLDVEKLIKVVGLLGSEHDGERASAARMASDLLKAYGITWEDVFRNAFGEAKALAQRVRQKDDEREDVERAWAQERYRRAQQANPRFKVYAGLNCAHILRALKLSPRNLTDWDRDFVDNVIRKGGAKDGMTVKQWSVILDLADKSGIVRRRQAL